MDKYILKVTLESEAVFNSGEEEQNLVNDKVLADEHGFVYFHAKTLKGQLRERAEWLGKKLANINDENKIDTYEKSIVKLFGSQYGRARAENGSQEGHTDNNDSNKTIYNNRGIMTLSNLKLKQEIRDYFKSVNNDTGDDFEYRITPYDMIEAQTNRRIRIKIGKNGSTEDRMMMTYHTVKNGLTFYSDMNFLEKLNDTDLTALNAIVNSLESIGSAVNRGRGKIKAELFYDNGKKVEASNLGVFLGE